MAQLMITFWLILIVMFIVALAFAVGIFSCNSNDKKLLFVIFMFLGIGSIGLYLHWGNSAELSQKRVRDQQKELASTIQKFRDPQLLIARMQAILKDKPDSARGWYLLGRLYLSQKQFKEAEDSLARAYQLQPSQPEIMLQYAEIIYYTHQQQLTDQGRKILRDLLKIQNNNVNAYNFLALDAYNRGAYQYAIGNWQQMLRFIPPESSTAKVIVKAINSAYQKIKNDR